MKNGNTVRTFTNKAYADALIKASAIQSPTKTMSLRKRIAKIIKSKAGQGKNRIVWKGKWTKGNVDIYLFSGMLSLLRNGALTTIVEYS